MNMILCDYWLLFIPWFGFLTHVSQQTTIFELQNRIDGNFLNEIPRALSRRKRSNSSSLSRALRIQPILEIYPKCHKEYGCIGNNEDCIASRSCKSLITYKSMRNLTLISFQMFAQFPAPKRRMRKDNNNNNSSSISSSTSRSTEKGYVAIGISYDQKMGEDAVVECTFLPDGEFGVYFSWNLERGHQHRRVQHLDCGSSTRVLTDCSAAVVDGIMTCNFSLDEHFIKHEHRFDLVYEEYFIFTAIGSQLNASQISKHDEVFVTSSKISLNYIQEPLTFGYETKLHAILMTYVWLVFVPSSIFLARYFKESFFKNQGQVPRLFLGRRVYFSLHVSVVFVGFLCLITSIGYILYVTYKKRHRWSEVANIEIHMKIGGAACLLYVIQMASGWVRPIDQGNRRIFSVGHWLIGTFSQLLSFVNLLMSPRLKDTKVPCVFSLIVIVWLIYTIMSHLLMAVHFRWIDGKLGRRTKRGLSPFPMQNVTRQSTPGLKRRTAIFIFYFVGCLSLAITSNILILNSTKDCNCETTFCYV